MKGWITAIGAIGFGLASLAPAAMAANQGVTGAWLVEDGKATVDIEPCGASVCGTIAWMKNPLNDAGKPKTDIHNSDPAQQDRKLCGMQILWGFSKDSDGAWSGGQIYDAEHGKTYSSNIHVQDDGTLSLRGYIGLSIFGKSQVWTRPAAPLPHC